MRALFAVVISLVCILALVFWLARTEPAGVVPLPSAGDAAQASPHLEGRDESLTPAPATEAAERVPSTTQAAAPASAVVQGPRCRVLGRALDDAGAPLADVSVTMNPVGGRWSDTATIEKSGAPGQERERLSTSTGTDGRFTFEAPLPTADLVRLNLEPDAYHANHSKSFDPAGESNQPRIVEGDNDFGDIVLRGCGAASGRIISVDGRPISKARVIIRNPAEGGWASTASDEDGRFVAGHAVPGNRTIDVSAEGWITKEQIPVEIRLRETTSMPDIVLSPAFSVAGDVVDDKGAPVPGVLLSGTQSERKRGHARTNDDGTFTLYLEKEEPVDLEIQNAKGFEKWGGGPDARVEIGTQDVHIVLRRSAVLTFKIVDAISGQPIERFGLRLDPKPMKGTWNSAVEKELQIGDHPGGLVRVPLSNPFVVVDAPDHAPTETDVMPDERDGDVQTIALRPGARIRGRLVASGTPFAKGSLLLRPEAIDEKRTYQFEPGVFGSVTYDVTGYSGRPQTDVSADDGTFEFGGLAPGTYALQVVGPGIARKMLRGVSVPLDGVVELGDVVLVSGATIRGVLVVEEGRSPEGFKLRLYTDSFLRARHHEIDNIDGKFELAGLEAGNYNLSWSRPTQDSWIDHDPHRVPVSLAAGEVREVILDARGSEPCKVIVHVRRRGEPVPGTRVATRIRSTTKPDNQMTKPLGTSGPDGVVVGEVDGDLVFELLAETEAGQTLGSAGPGIRAVPGGRIEHVIEIAAGTLVVELQSGFAVPKQGGISLQLSVGEKTPMRLFAQTPEMARAYDGVFMWKGERIRFGECQAGEYDAVVKIYRYEADASQPGGRRSFDMREAYKTKVVVEADKETKIVVP